MKVELREFIAFLQSKLKPAIPIEVTTRATSFAPFWQSYVLFISSHLEKVVSSDVSETHNYFLHHIPTVAIVPRRDVFVVFIKKSEYDDVYLAYNASAAAIQSGVYFYVVPYIEKKAVEVAIANRLNPAILSDLLYILPILSSIPCTDLIEETPLIKDYLTIKMHSYIASDDLGQVLLGYTLLKLLSMPLRSNYEKIFETVKSMILSQLEKRNLYVTNKEIMVEYIEFPIKLNIILIKALL